MATTTGNFEMSEAEQILDENLKKLDDLRVDNLKNLHAMRLTKTNQLDREYQRLSLKYGEDHPLTKRTGEKIELNKIYEKEIEEEIVKAETPPPVEEPTPEEIPLLKDWTVTGRILDQKGNGIRGLKVKVYDKDVFDDDFLGEGKTNAKGAYRVTFPKERFSDVFENYPEIYLLVEDANGRTIYNGMGEPNYGAGYIEILNVQLKDSENKR